MSREPNTYMNYVSKRVNSKTERKSLKFKPSTYFMTNLKPQRI